jgi:abequosyltransferase
VISLCVPTYNRAALLRRMLPRLVDAVEEYRGPQRFEICVSDNASADDTPAVVAACAAGPVPVRHARQATNLGYAGNFAAVARLASGDGLVILADDDELEAGALELLAAGAERLGATRPLVLFDTLPGGDAVARRLARPTGETSIDGPADLLRRLGIFHATFVSNLLFHREAALPRLDARMLMSRYPHTALALSLLTDAPAWFLPGRLVRVTLPPDAGDQPLLTSVDMARVMSDYALTDPRCNGLAWPVYRFLLRMLPTALYQQRRGHCGGDAANPFADLRLANVLDCYRQSTPARLAARALWLAGRGLPASVLGLLLRRLSRHPR